MKLQIMSAKKPSPKSGSKKAAKSRQPVASGGKSMTGATKQKLSAAKQKLFDTVAPYVGPPASASYAYTKDLLGAGRDIAVGYGRKLNAEANAKDAEALAKKTNALIQLSERYDPETATWLMNDPEAYERLERAKPRVLRRIEREQRNLESVVSQTEQNIAEDVSKDPVHPDWIDCFMESVKGISDETMQKLWASVLAGEVTSPGKVSLRTLNILKNLSKEEAETFQKILSLAIHHNAVYYPPEEDEKTLIAKKILSPGWLLRMKETQLIDYGAFMAIEQSEVKEWKKILGTHLIGIYPTSPNDTFSFNMPVFNISTAGRELAGSILPTPTKAWYIHALVQFFSNSKPNSIFSRSDKARFFLHGKIPKGIFIGPNTYRFACETEISPEMSEKEIQHELDKCPECTIGKASSTRTAEAIKPEDSP